MGCPLGLWGAAWGELGGPAVTDVLSAAPLCCRARCRARRPSPHRRRRNGAASPGCSPGPGFGASVDEIDQAAAKGYAAAVEELLAFPPAATRPDEATVLAAGGRRPGRRVGGLQHGDVPAVVARPHVGHPLPAGGEAHPLLAQPLRHRLLQGRAGRRRWWPRTGCCATTPAATSGRCATPSPPIRPCSSGSTGTRTRRSSPTRTTAASSWSSSRSAATATPRTTCGEAARAFTGYTTDGQGRALYHPELHDDGDKTILGQTGNWGPTDMTDIVLDRHPDGPVAARYVSARLAGFLYKPDPEPEVVDAMATAFVASGLRHQGDGPGAAAAAGVQRRAGPHDQVAGRVRRRHDAPAPPDRRARRRRPSPAATSFDEIASACADMGQELFEPPDVSGWKGGATVGQHGRHAGPLQLRRPHREAGHRQRRAHRPRLGRRPAP